MNLKRNILVKLLFASVLIAKTGFVNAQGTKNWEFSFGIEGLSFYEKGEQGLPTSPLERFRTTLGASAAATKWFAPSWGVRTKLSGYWGKRILGESSEDNSMRFYSVQEHIIVSIPDLIKKNSKRIYDIMPYAGLGFSRDCTHNDNEFTYGGGINNTFRLSNHLKLNLDLSANLTNSYRWTAAEMGLTFCFPKNGEKNANVKGMRQRITGTADYSRILFSNHETDSLGRILANNRVPDGMVLINRGHIRMGLEYRDTIMGQHIPVKDISVDDFLMDRTEVTNEQYRAFVDDILERIINQRLNDPQYNKDRKKVIASLMITNPVTGKKTLDGKLLNYKYDWYDELESLKNKYRKHKDVVIQKDTAYFDDNGRIIRKKITRQYTGDYDFLNTYIVNVYPDTTVWVNDFPNADNALYVRYYFSHANYAHYPVVGVTWEQANAYCAWRTEKRKEMLGGDLGEEQPYRLPTESEWEYAARGRSQNAFPWESEEHAYTNYALLANFLPDDGDYTKDGNIITARVGTYPANSSGLYDMAGNVAEWTSTPYTATGVQDLNNINPYYQYNAAEDDPKKLKRKNVRGGSWKDPESRIQSAWRSYEYQDIPRSYIGFRCVRSLATKPTQRAIQLKK